MSPEEGTQGQGWRRWLGGLQDPLPMSPEPIKVCPTERASPEAGAWEDASRSSRAHGIVDAFLILSLLQRLFTGPEWNHESRFFFVRM